MVRNALALLGDFGQSVWCDDISREFLLTGQLKALIAEDGVSGVTSNPTIFHKAITESTAYDEALRLMAAEGLDAEAIMESLMVEDITAAADQLHSVHEQTRARDGWVSIEVAPTCAHDTRRTIAEVMRVRSLVDRPNVLIKVPATEEGVAAVRELTGRGYSINVTLIFSLERYREVMEAYLTGLRGAAGAASDRGGRSRPSAKCTAWPASSSAGWTRAVDKRLETLVGQPRSQAVGGSASGADLRSCGAKRR